MRRAELTGNLPLRTVLAPQTNTILPSTANTMFVMQLDQTSAKIGATFIDSLIITPFIGTPFLGNGVKITLA